MMEESAITDDVICGERQSRCYCAEPYSHEGARHACACGGSWSEDEMSMTIWAPPGTAEGYDMHPAAASMAFPLTVSKAPMPQTNDLSREISERLDRIRKQVR